MNTLELFKSLHQQQAPLLIGNVWDGQSAKVMEGLKFQAVATSSAAVAETLGYADGENMSFEEYLFMARRIKASTKLPLSIDLETGFGKTTESIVSNLKQLHQVGVVGINIEDSCIQDGERSIEHAEKFAEKLKSICTAMQDQRFELFINVRCDAFLLGLKSAREEAIRRIKLYEGTGVHGIFLPCITDIEDIKACVKATRLPLNVMCMPELPGFEKLQQAGVKRISMGNFVNKHLYKEMEQKIKLIVKQENFSSLF
jgi:2-methylisocitrate lyase-like PEP mutase family enzyme